MSSKKVNLIVAVCNNKGIGIKGQLPWRLRGDMAFFKRVTSETHEKDKKNAVIMGRKTWDSIPEKFRPLQNRLNIVISRTLQAELEGVCVAKSFEEAMAFVQDQKDSIENVFVIGGHSIYKMALESDHCHRVYMTRVLADFECDTHMPDLDETDFKLVADPKVNSDVQSENDISYKFEVYEKISRDAVTMNIMVAFVEQTRGFGNKGQLPWPFIQKDFDHYTFITSRKSDPAKKNCYIKGRDTWLSTTGLEAERSNPHVLNIVVSKALVNEPRQENLHYVVDSLCAAMETVQSLKSKIENVWIMGGTGIYAEALTLAQCTRVYVTRIYNCFEADRFFPRFEDMFDMTSDPDVLGGLQEENGYKFQFEVYERKHLRI